MRDEIQKIFDDILANNLDLTIYIREGNITAIFNPLYGTDNSYSFVETDLKILFTKILEANQREKFYYDIT